MKAKDMKNARVDIKTTKAAKVILEQAATAMGTTLSAFLIDSAMKRAREIITQSQMITLTHREAERFVAALKNPPKANTRLRQLLKNQNTRYHQDRTRSA